MAKTPDFIKLLQDDPRFKLEAYLFVRDALNYAQETLQMGRATEFETGKVERHISGQQLCQAVRLFALEQFGYMALTVLKDWGIRSTSDVGEIVYNMIRSDMMKKSDEDRREDFDDVYNFQEALQEQFEITIPE